MFDYRRVTGGHIYRSHTHLSSSFNSISFLRTVLHCKATGIDAAERTEVADLRPPGLFVLIGVVTFLSFWDLKLV